MSLDEYAANFIASIAGSVAGNKVYDLLGGGSNDKKFPTESKPTAAEKYGLLYTPETVSFTDKILMMPRLTELGMSPLLSGILIAHTPGVSESMPDSFPILAKSYRGCWVERGTTILKYLIPHVDFNKKSSWFGRTKDDGVEFTEVDIKSPISGMIVGFRSSDNATELTENGVRNRTKQGVGVVWCHSLPVLLIPKDEPKPSSCGYEFLFRKTSSYKDYIKISEGDYPSRSWVKLCELGEIAESLTSELDRFVGFEECD